MHQITKYTYISLKTLLNVYVKNFNGDYKTIYFNFESPVS